MRQAGIIAAGRVYALENNVQRLAEDHQNAALLARGLAEIDGIALDPESVQTNIVFFDVSGSGMSAFELSTRLVEHGVRIGAVDEARMRAVTHLDVDRAGVEAAVRAVGEIVKSS